MHFHESTRMNAFRWTLALAALGLLVAPVDAALCVKRSGAIFARAACTQKEKVLSADVFSGSPGPAGVAGSPGPAGVAGAKGDKGDKGDRGESGGLRVIDSTGRQTGVVDAYSEMTALIPSVGFLSFVVGPDGFDGYNGKPYLHHEESNCGGAAFVSRSVYDGFVQYADVFAGTAYYAGNPIAKHTFNSYEYPAPTCTALTPRGFCCVNNSSPSTQDAGPVQTFNLLSLGTPPFSVVR